MKRVGNIFERVIDRENLAAAFNRVCKGKRGRSDIRRYVANLEENLNSLHRELADGTFRFSRYNFFKISDPKERTIAAASVDERIVHHAFIAVIGERLERSLIDKSYACRKGKGQWSAVAEASRLARRHEWCLKMDIKRYFDSIDHGILLRLISRKIKDKRLMAVIRQLVESYETAPGKGVPIGNLTSQYFANLYLDGLDRFLTQSRRVAEVRYMDDVLVFGGHEDLRAFMNVVPGFLHETLKLELKPKGGLHRTVRGVGFLGTRIFPNRVELARKNKVRFRRRLAALDAMIEAGAISEQRYQERTTALFAFARKCDSYGFRQKTISEDGQGTPRRRAWRCVVQQQQRGLCRLLPFGVSLQQLERRKQQQQLESRQYFEGLGLSRCLLPRSSKADGTHLNRPFSRSSCGALGTTRPTAATNTPCPCGAGRRAAGARDARPYQTERHAGRLQRIKGLDEETAVAHGKDVAARSRVTVDQPIVLVEKFTDVSASYFGYHASGKREVGKLKRRVDDAVLESVSRGRVLRNAENVVTALSEPTFAPWRPFDFHGCIPTVGAASRSAWRRARSSSGEKVSPRSISSSAARTSSMIAIASRIRWKSATSTRNDAARPFCVTRIGRCVRRVFKMQSAIVPRNSESGMMSSEKLMSARGFSCTRMSGVSLKVADIVRNSVCPVKGAICF